MEVAELDYDLPDAAIAQRPIEPRDAARLLVDQGPGAVPAHRIVRDLPTLLDAGDLLVLNDTRVRRARLQLRKPSGGRVEVLLLDDLGGQRWEALVRPSRKVAPGTVLAGEPGTGGEEGVVVEVGDDLGGGRRIVTVLAGDAEAAGEVPLPPYIHETLDDPERYQTVYARRAASAAAPTAGLHLTDEVLSACRAAGVDLARVELVVGLDTFRPIATNRVEDHAMHTESYDVPAATWDAVERTRASGGRIVAVGTTVVRALESVAARGALTGRTDLLIRPGHRWVAVDRLLTNFHVPRTTLLALVAAFVGPRWRELYATALAEGYRFLSFGDASLLTRSDEWR